MPIPAQKSAAEAWSDALTAVRVGRSELADETADRQHIAEFVLDALSDLMATLVVEGLAPRTVEEG
jgi:hypothetical protein